MNSTLYVDEYTRFLSEVRHKSRNTIDSYRRDVVHYITYLDNIDTEEITNVTRATVMSYLLSMQNKGCAASSVSRALASLKSFYMFLIKNGNISVNPTESIELPKPERSIPQTLTEEEIEMLLSAPNTEDFKGIRDKAMLELLYATGVRVSELINLNVSDINIPMSFIYCRSSRKERPIPIGRSAAEALDEYIKNARPSMIHSSAENALFVNINGSRLTRQGFWKILKHYGKEAGIESEITPHILRHSFALHLVHNGADLESIQELMGHVNIASTQVYSHLPDTKLRRVYEKTHPRA